MVIKTFNVNENAYKKFSAYCKEMGLSMSSQINTFIKSQVEEDPQVREKYLEKLTKIRKGKFVEVSGSLMEHLQSVQKRN
jgi:antitoxin component of RelBE/YafQ-DinJ toxin-antitoxin module